MNDQSSHLPFELRKTKGILSLETRKKMRSAKLGKKKSRATREKMSACRSGEKNHNWQGGAFVDHRGYVLVLAPDHPDADSSGYIRKHRLLMEIHIGRRLSPTEVVHHKNEDKLDNRIENLQLFVRSEHARLKHHHHHA